MEPQVTALHASTWAPAERVVKCRGPTRNLVHLKNGERVGVARESDNIKKFQKMTLQRSVWLNCVAIEVMLHFI
jgi:hypothetical protein